MSEETHGIRIQRNLLIPMSDGVELAGDLCLPEGEGPCPVLLSFYPYHKDDLVAGLHTYPSRYFAHRGYASLLVDFRGLGSSDGEVWPAFDPGEGRDSAEVVEWAAQQPWCDGNVGMWGISYGGISSLKTAAENPPHLKAIVPIQGTDDLYEDSLYSGGCLSCLPAFGAWGSWMLAMNLMPPTYADPEGRWYRVWKQRLASSVPYVMPWQEQSAFDDYWRSRATKVENIRVPAFFIGGWRDIFPTAVPRNYGQVKGPKKLLMGPWMHGLPDSSAYEPVDYLHEMARWWDRWLRGIDNGIDKEPAVTHFVQNAPQPWRSERRWPITRAKDQRFYLWERGALAPEASVKEGGTLFKGKATTGTHAGLWDPTALGLGLPLDQCLDDLTSLVFNGGPLREAIEIAGSPEATVRVGLEAGADFNLVVKLSEVAPDGRSSLITTGWLKGSHHASHETPAPPQRGRAYDLRVKMATTSYHVPRGHRLRLAISTSDFPRLWPTPESPTIRVHFGGRRGGSQIKIPVVAADKNGVAVAEVRRPDPAVNRAPLAAMTMIPRWTIERDLATGEAAVITGSQQKMNLPDGGGSLATNHKARASASDLHPEAAKVEAETRLRLELRSIGTVEVETTSHISQRGLVLEGRVKIDGQMFFEKRWSK